MSFFLRAFLWSAASSAGLFQTSDCLAQQVPSVPGLPTVPGPPRTPGLTSGLPSGITSFRQNPRPAVAPARRFDEGGISTVPGADSATQSTNATNATSVTSGEGFSNRRR